VIWREPDEESVDLYPGLVVHDGRQSGSITVDRSRLPYWAFAGWDWDEIVTGWDYITTDYGWTEERHRLFLHDLLEPRGEFARLLLVIADAERCDRVRGGVAPWWETKRHRKRVGDQLRRCLAMLEAA
jgi:hypothetical protein